MCKFLKKTGREKERERPEQDTPREHAFPDFGNSYYLAILDGGNAPHTRRFHFSLISQNGRNWKMCFSSLCRSAGCACFAHSSKLKYFETVKKEAVPKLGQLPIVVNSKSAIFSLRGYGERNPHQDCRKHTKRKLRIMSDTGESCPPVKEIG